MVVLYNFHVWIGVVFMKWQDDDIYYIHGLKLQKEKRPSCGKTWLLLTDKARNNGVSESFSCIEQRRFVLLYRFMHRYRHRMFFALLIFLLVWPGRKINEGIGSSSILSATAARGSLWPNQDHSQHLVRVQEGHDARGCQSDIDRPQIAVVLGVS